MAYVGLVTFAVRMADTWRRQRSRRRTRYIIERLPASIRKDIGWSDSDHRLDPHGRF